MEATLSNSSDAKLQLIKNAIFYFCFSQITNKNLFFCLFQEYAAYSMKSAEVEPTKQVCEADVAATQSTQLFHQPPSKTYDVIS